MHLFSLRIFNKCLPTLNDQPDIIISIHKINVNKCMVHDHIFSHFSFSFIIRTLSFFMIDEWFIGIAGLDKKSADSEELMTKWGKRRQR